MSQHQDRALVLDIMDYRETSSLVRVFTEHDGRISLVARGLRKPKIPTGVAALQPFNLVRIKFFLKEGSTIGNFVEADLEQTGTAARESLEAYALMSYWFEILRETSQAGEAPSNIFQLSVDTLQKQKSAPGLTIDYLRDLTRLCGYLGFGISWQDCVFCGQDADRPGVWPSSFSITQGGVLCSDCVNRGEAGIPLKEAEQTTVGSIAADDNPKRMVPEIVLLDLLTLINRFLTHHLEHPLKTLEFVKNTIGD